MSRAVRALFLICACTAATGAQTAPKSDVVDALVKKNADMAKPEPKKKCPEPSETEEIVVCGETDNGEDQLIFEDQRQKESSGARTNANAAACIPGTGCRQPLTGGRSFGKRRPPAIPIEEVYRGLPEPEMVVPEGSGDKPEEEEPGTAPR